MATIQPKTIALVGMILLSCTLYTGIIFGWAPLLLLLLEENQYAELCPEGATLPCKDQENKLNLLFALASFAVNAGALPVGTMLDSYGPKFAVSIAGCCVLVGLVLMGLSDSKSFDAFLPGYILLAVGGQITMLSAYPVSFLVIQFQTAILAAISCLFDGSSVIFLLFYSMHEVFGLSRSALFFGYAVIAAVIYPLLVWFWNQNEDLLNQQNDANETIPLLEVAPSPQLVYGLQSAESKKAEEEAETRMVQGLARASLPEQIRTFEFVYVLLYAGIQILRTNIYIGTSNKLLLAYGDDLTGFFYTKVFSVVLPLGFIFVPCIDHVVENRGLYESLTFTNILALTYNALAMIPYLPLQCAVFFIFTGYRAFLYTVISAFCAKTFGLQNLGKLLGIIFSTGAIVNLLEYPAVEITNDFFNGDLHPLYILKFALALVLFPLTWVYLRKANARKEEEECQEPYGCSHTPKLV